LLRDTTNIPVYANKPQWAPKFDLSSTLIQNLSKKYNKQEVFKSDSVVSENIPVNFPYRKIIKSEKSIPFYNLFLLLIFFLVFILIVIRLKYFKYVAQLFNATINNHEAYRLYREQNPTIDNIFMLLYVISVFTLSFLLFFLIQFYNIFNVSNLIVNKIFISFILVSSYLIYNSIIHRLFGFIFSRPNDFREYRLYKALFIKLIGLCLLPVIILVGLSSKENVYPFVISGIIITLGLYLLSILKGSLLMVSKNIKVRYWVLYVLCIELLPLIISYKILRTIL
jgi:hypothetical protein